MEARPFRINGFLARQLSQKWSKVKRFKGALQCTWLSPISADSGKVPTGSPTSVVITVFNPTGNAQNFTVSKSKFTPSPRHRVQHLRRRHHHERFPESRSSRAFRCQPGVHTISPSRSTPALLGL